MKQFKNVEIILEESQAVLANSLYIIPLGNGKAKAIVTDANANKVAITSYLTPQELDTLLQPLNEAAEAANEAAEAANEAAENALIGSTSLGTITPSSTIPAEGNIWGFAGEGTYPNAGNITVETGKFAILSRVGTTWSKVEVALQKGADGADGADGKTIEDWSAKSYTAGSQVFYNGKIYELTAPATATDIPDTATMFSEKLNSGDVYNITANKPLSAGSFYTLNTAISAIPTYIRKKGLIVRYLSSSFEALILKITATATADGNVTVVLNGVNFNIAVLSGDTAIQVADKIRAGVFSGWAVSGTAGTDTVTFTAQTSGEKLMPLYYENATGALGEIYITKIGEELWNEIIYLGTDLVGWNTVANWRDYYQRPKFDVYNFSKKI